MSKQGPLNNPELQNRLRRLDKQRDTQRLADMGWVMAAPQGRRFMWDLIDNRCGVTSGFVPDPRYETHLRARESIGHEIRAAVQKHFRKQYVEMLAEALADRENDELNRASAQDAATKEQEADGD